MYGPRSRPTNDATPNASQALLELGFKGLASIGAVPACARKASPASSYLTRQIRFENRQKTSHVDFVLNNGTTLDKPLIDSTLGGVALFDFDNDGFLDIFFTNGARIHDASL
jgi:hypothetical protein